MKKNIIIASNVAAIGIILNQFGFWNALVLFLLAGVIPGTTMTLPALVMLAIIMVAMSGCFVLFNSLRVATTESGRKSLPRKRYSRV